MKKLWFLPVFGLLIYACAPVGKCKPYENTAEIPKSFKANGYVSYGILSYPISLIKADKTYTLKSFLGDLNFKTGNICAYGSCIDLPIDVSKLIYGDVVDKSDKISCENGYTIYEGSEDGFIKKVYVKDGKLYKMDIMDKNKQKQISVYFKDRSKDGYYKDIEIRKKDFGIDLKINSLESV